jgi:general secretion pathway protein D
LTSDRQKAEIVVGQNVPFPGAQSQTVGGNVQTTIERKDVGITLRLTPVIMANNKVKMDLFQEISSVVATAGTGSASLGPTTNKRSATTNVIVNDGQTAVIGGLIRDDVILTTTSIPFLGRIPLLGWFFKKESKRTEKTNLLIFVTPYIVPEGEGKGGLDAIRGRKLKETLDFMEKNKVEGGDGRKETIDKMIAPPEE